MKRNGMPQKAETPATPPPDDEPGQPGRSKPSLPNLPLDLVVTTIFMTRLPVPWRGDIDPQRLARAFWTLPVIGVLVGGVAGGALYAGTTLGLPPLAAAFFALAAAALLTGALHEDGLADCADAFGGGQSRERKLEIMRDSRIGTYGVVALIFALGLRVVLFAALAGYGWWAIAHIAAAAAVSRGLIPLAMRLSRPARQDGLGAGAGIPPWLAVMVAAGLALSAALGAAWPLAGLIAFASAMVAAGAMVVLAGRQIGGYTGDVLGALQQVSELAFLAALVCAL